MIIHIVYRKQWVSRKYVNEIPVFTLHSNSMKNENGKLKKRLVVPENN